MKAFYEKHLSSEQDSEQSLIRRNTRLSFLRLGLFVGGLLAFYFLFEIAWWIAVASLLLCMSLFLWVVKLHLNNEGKLDFTRRRIRLLTQELDFIGFRFGSQPDGSSFEPAEHAYASDLDLFGKHSLFQYVNRAVTFFGQEKLAAWFLKAPGLRELRLRQESASELSGKFQFRINYLSTLLGFDTQLLPQLRDWSEKKDDNVAPAWFRYFLWGYLLLLWPMVLGGVFEPVLWDFLPYIFGISVFFHIRYFRFFMAEHAQVSRTGSLLAQVSHALQLVEDEEFSAEQLQALQNDLKQEHKATFYIRKLSKHIANWDFRLNMIVYILLAMFFLWDVLCLLRIESWKKEHKSLIKLAIEKLADIEALLSLGALQANHPGWVFPNIEEGAVPEFEAVGHPLLPAEKRVVNDMVFRSVSDLIFVSGSNMSGKSTFLRTLGVNLVLGQMGAVVCARKMSCMPVQLFSIMRIKDSLEENTSTFYFEIKRIKQLLTQVEETGNVFYLLDELLRGTNSHDKHYGTKALMEWLMKHNGLGLVASHDLALSEMEEEHALFENYHFDVEIGDRGMDFDYKLRKGACTQFNADVLLREIGIEIEQAGMAISSR